MTKIPIVFSDLSHVGHSCNNTPYSISLVASYSLKKFEREIEPQIFKSPVDLIQSVEREMPGVACFTNYIWNANLSLAISREIKNHSPTTVIIFGGPNYPFGAGRPGKFSA